MATTWTWRKHCVCVIQWFHDIIYTNSCCMLCCLYVDAIYPTFSATILMWPCVTWDRFSCINLKYAELSKYICLENMTFLLRFSYYTKVAPINLSYIADWNIWCIEMCLNFNAAHKSILSQHNIVQYSSLIASPCGVASPLCKPSKARN